MKRKIVIGLLIGLILVGNTSLILATTATIPETSQEAEHIQESIVEETIFDLELEEVSVELFDINSVEYTGKSVLPVMTAIVIGVAILAVTLIVYALKKREYKEE